MIWICVALKLGDSNWVSMDIRYIIGSIKHKLGLRRYIIILDTRIGSEVILYLSVVDDDYNTRIGPIIITFCQPVIIEIYLWVYYNMVTTHYERLVNEYR